MATRPAGAVRQPSTTTAAGATAAAASSAASSSAVATSQATQNRMSLKKSMRGNGTLGASTTGNNKTLINMQGGSSTGGAPASPSSGGKRSTLNKRLSLTKPGASSVAAAGGASVNKTSASLPKIGTPQGSPTSASPSPGGSARGTPQPPSPVSVSLTQAPRPASPAANASIVLRRPPSPGLGNTLGNNLLSIGLAAPSPGHSRRNSNSNTGHLGVSPAPGHGRSASGGIPLPVEELAGLARASNDLAFDQVDDMVLGNGLYRDVLRIVRLIAAQPSCDQMVLVLEKHARHLVKADIVRVLLVTRHGFTHPTLSQALSLDHGLASHCIHKRECLNMSNPAADPRFYSDTDQISEKVPLFYVCVPVEGDPQPNCSGPRDVVALIQMFKESAPGAPSASSSSSSGPFSLTDIKIVQRLAEFVGNMLLRSRHADRAYALYNSSVSTQKRSAALLDVAKALSSETRLSDVVSIIVSQVPEMLDCISAGSLVALRDGTSVPIEQVQVGQEVLALHGKEEGLVAQRVTATLPRGQRECVELLFSDGRTLTCTPNHRFQSRDGAWHEAHQLVLGQTQLSVGVEHPASNPLVDDVARDAAWSLDLTRSLGYTLNLGATRRAQAMAFARLVGYSSATTAGEQQQQAMVFRHFLDAEQCLVDIELLTGQRPTCQEEEAGTWTLALPNELAQAIATVVDQEERTAAVTHLPQVFLDVACPLALLREFLGGLFGAAGSEVALDTTRGVLSGVGFAAVREGHLAQKQLAVFQAELVPALMRFGFDHLTADDWVMTTSATATELTELRLPLTSTDRVKFLHAIGYRYASAQQLRLSAASAYWRVNEFISNERREIQRAIADHRAQWPGCSIEEATRAAKDGMTSMHPVNQQWNPTPIDVDADAEDVHADGLPLEEALDMFDIRKFFAATGSDAKSVCGMSSSSRELPLFQVTLLSRRPVGLRSVYDLTVPNECGARANQSFTAGGVVVHNCDRCTLFFCDRDRGELIVTRGASHGRPKNFVSWIFGQSNAPELPFRDGENEIRFSMANGIAGQVARTGETINLEDAHKSEKFNATIDKETGYRTRSMLCVPMIDGRGETIGVVQAINKQVGASWGNLYPRFDAQDETLLKTFSAQAAVAVRNSRLFEKTENALKQSDALLEVANALSSELKIEGLIAIICSKVQSLMRCERCTVFVVDKERKELYTSESMSFGMGAALPIDKERARLIYFAMDRGIAGSVATTGAVANLPDAYKDARFNKAMDKETGFRTRSVLAMAIKNSAQEVTGVLQLVNKLSPTGLTGTDARFASEDEQALKAFCAQAAVAIENSKLFSETEKALNHALSDQRNLKFMLSVTKNLFSDMHLTSMIDQMTMQVHHLLKADDCALYLVDQATKQFWLAKEETGSSDPNVHKHAFTVGIVGAVAATGETVRISTEAHRDPRFSPLVDQRKNKTTHSILTCPIISEASDGVTKIVGVISVRDEKDRGGFEQEEEKLLKVFCAQAAVAITNSKRFSSIMESQEFKESDHSAAEYLKKNRGMQLADDDIAHFQYKMEDIVMKGAIGNGSYGEVYRAMVNGSIVAVKKLHVRNLKAEQVDAFCKEASLMCQLKHTNIVGFIGAVTEPSNLCIITQYCLLSSTLVARADGTQVEVGKVQAGEHLFSEDGEMTKVLSNRVEPRTEMIHISDADGNKYAVTPEHILVFVWAIDAMCTVTTAPTVGGYRVVYANWYDKAMKFHTVPVVKYRLRGDAVAADENEACDAGETCDEPVEVLPGFLADEGVARQKGRDFLRDDPSCQDRLHMGSRVEITAAEYLELWSTDGYENALTLYCRAMFAPLPTLRAPGEVRPAPAIAPKVAEQAVHFVDNEPVWSEAGPGDQMKIVYMLHNPVDHEATLLDAKENFAFALRQLVRIWQLTQVSRLVDAGILVTELNPIASLTGAMKSTDPKYDEVCQGSMTRALETGTSTIIAFGAFALDRWKTVDQLVAGVTAMDLTKEGVVSFQYQGRIVTVFTTVHPCVWSQLYSILRVVAKAHEHAWPAAADTIRLPTEAELLEMMYCKMLRPVKEVASSGSLFEVAVIEVDNKNATFLQANGTVTHNCSRGSLADLLLSHCLAVGTLVQLADGRVLPCEKVAPGDVLMSQANTEVVVDEVSSFTSPENYAVATQRGAAYTVSADHQITVRCEANPRIELRQRSQHQWEASVTYVSADVKFLRRTFAVEVTDRDTPSDLADEQDLLAADDFIAALDDDLASVRSGRALASVPWENELSSSRAPATTSSEAEDSAVPSASSAPPAVTGSRQAIVAHFTRIFLEQPRNSYLLRGEYADVRAKDLFRRQENLGLFSKDRSQCKVSAAFEPEMVPTEQSAPVKSREEAQADVLALPAEALVLQQFTSMSGESAPVHASRAKVVYMVHNTSNAHVDASSAHGPSKASICIAKVQQLLAIQVAPESDVVLAELTRSAGQTDQSYDRLCDASLSAALSLQSPFIVAFGHPCRERWVARAGAMARAGEWTQVEQKTVDGLKALSFQVAAGASTRTVTVLFALHPCTSKALPQVARALAAAHGVAKDVADRVAAESSAVNQFASIDRVVDASDALAGVDVVNILVRGATLADRRFLLADGTVTHNSVDMNMKLKMKFAIDAARGLIYLHNSNPVILHRDLKSDNLLVTQEWIVKVADFGLTRFISEKKQMTQVGTPMWMAPEIIMGRRYTEKADVYAFGIILWEILTRLEPYEDKEPMQIVVEVVNDGLRPTLPPPMDQSPLVPLMKDAWGENPEHRPSFEKILERLLQIDSQIPADDNSLYGIPGTSRPINKHAIAHAQAAVIGNIH